MTILCLTSTSDNWKYIVPLTIGILGFISAILTLMFSYYHNKVNLNFLLEKDKRDREDRLKKDELDFAKDKRERQKAYNRVLGSFLKVYHSYIKHKYLYNEDGVANVPENFLIQALEKIDNFNAEICAFKISVSTETEIIPELTIYLHEILDLLGRFELLNSQIPNDINNPQTEQTKLILKRAHVFAVKELLDEYFSELIEKLAVKADVTEDFLKLIKDFNSDEVVQRNVEIQQEIMERLMQSLSKQTGQDVSMNDFK